MVRLLLYVKFCARTTPYYTTSNYTVKLFVLQVEENVFLNYFFSIMAFFDTANTNKSTLFGQFQSLFINIIRGIYGSYLQYLPQAVIYVLLLVNSLIFAITGKNSMVTKLPGFLKRGIFSRFQFVRDNFCNNQNFLKRSTTVQF